MPSAKSKRKNVIEAEIATVVTDTEDNPEQVVALDADDSMFKPSISKTRLGGTQRPVRTRAATARTTASAQVPAVDSVKKETTIAPPKRPANAGGKSNKKPKKKDDAAIQKSDLNTGKDGVHEKHGGDNDAIYESDVPLIKSNQKKRKASKKDSVNLNLSEQKKSKLSHNKLVVKDTHNRLGTAAAPDASEVQGRQTKKSKTGFSGTHTVPKEDKKHSEIGEQRTVKKVSEAAEISASYSQNGEGDADSEVVGEGTDDQDDEILPRHHGGHRQVVQDSDSEQSSHGSDVNMDEYDLEDSFINDSDQEISASDDNPFVQKLKASGVGGGPDIAKTSKGKGKVQHRHSPDWNYSQLEAEEDNTMESEGEHSESYAEAALINQAMKESLLTTPKNKGSTSTNPSAGSSSQSRSTIGASMTNSAGPAGLGTGRRTLRDLVGSKPALLVKPETPTHPRTREPVNEYRVKTLPKKCEVFNEILQDPILVEFYAGLPALSLCVFMTWADARGPGHYQFSSWGEQCPEMDADLCLGVLNFVHSGRFLNPARASPKITTALKVTPDGLRSNLMIGDEHAILITTMYSSISYLHTPPPSGVRNKYISGISHTQEWERQVSFIGMAFGHQTLNAQLLSDALSYTTRSGNRNFGSNNGFSSHPSPATGTRGGFSSSAARDIALHTLDRIPVYDARNTAFDTEKDWPNLAKLLPVFVDEVPRGSCVAVGYTSNTYFASEKWNVSANVHFVVVLGTPVNYGDD